MTEAGKIQKALRLHASPEKAKASAWFFKTGKGQYGYGDNFLGVTVPEQRAIARRFKNLSLQDIQTLLTSEFHEERLTALFILVRQFDEGDSEMQKKLFEFYLSHLKYINNWDLVDSSAHKIVGRYLLDKKITLLLSMAKSKNLWERRIAIISTFAFLANNNSGPSYQIADILLLDREDLIQKAVGWVLREAGKKTGEKELLEYLKLRYKELGRTALRYAIERFPKEKRLLYLAGVFGPVRVGK